MKTLRENFPSIRLSEQDIILDNYISIEKYILQVKELTVKIISYKVCS
jgi:hypothetical protein